MCNKSLYDIYNSYSYFDLKSLCMKAKTNEEIDFYKALINFYLERDKSRYEKERVTK